MADRDVIEKLKENWMQDPGWDIEETEGFEEHLEELLNFRKQKEAEWEDKRIEKKKARHIKVMEETGVCDVSITDALLTWEEIRYAAKLGKTTEQLMETQIFATLLQAAQLKRIADALEAISESDSLSETVSIWGT